MFGSGVLSMQCNNYTIYSGHYDGKLRISSLKTKKTENTLNLFKDGQIQFMKYFP